jgi:membrane glycosyltransferase
MLALATGITAGLLALGWPVLAAGGWTGWEAALMLCLAVNAPWLGLAAATGLAGFAVRLLARDPAAVVLPGLRQPGQATSRPPRTLVGVCVRLEAMDAVLPPLERLIRGLHAEAGAPQHFALAILSDTPDGPAAEAEARAVAELQSSLPEEALRYRRRRSNAGFKAGNIMDFLDAHAAGFDFLLVLDADSQMSASTVRRLVQVMQADPGLAILQPTVAGRRADSPFMRLFGFGHRHGARIWATGQAWWQGPEGAYWGHNALIRIEAFRAHARLPLLPGGEHILSHDHVEAALLHGAGWGVRVLPEDAGSAERHPPDILALLGRDLRWAAGNMQYRHLLFRDDLGRIGRFQLLQAILHYALAPLWFALLPLAALNAATGGGEGTERGALLLLLACGFLALNAPKLAGYAEALLRARRGRRVLLRCMGREMVMGLLLDPIAALDRSVTVLRLALGLRAGWKPQPREVQAVAWPEALHRFGWHMLTGAALLALFASAGAFAALVALPFLAGLLLAAPLCVLTSRPCGEGRATPRLAPAPAE